ncbi:MAG TPA: T9SS type B sorting domain-containing protein, partial [Parasegetibacter sp.]
TKYYITLTTAPGCVAYDSVFVDVRSFVTLTAGKDTSICEGDFAYLNPTGDALYFVWSHPELMDDYRLKRPTARPPATTTFEVIGSIGKCSATAEITVNVVPFPVANAGVGGMICYDSTFQLQGSIVGAFYNWSPINTLTNPTSLRPIARPHETTAYVLTVLDTLGCPKPSYDTVIIEVVPKVIANAGNDTAIVVGQPLQLRATGGETYIWNPPLGLDDPLSQTPVAVLQNSQEYVVKVTTIEGCHNFDTLSVTVYKTEPDIFVPNGFTPNADGHNDVLYAIPVGIESVEYFQIYNRWGKLVFSTNDLSKGWDGRVNGQPQASDSFVWMVRAKDYTGKTIFKKGTVVLIR